MSRQRATEEAASILRGSSYGIPVDVEKVAESHNVSVVEQDLEDSVSGVLVVKDGRGIIGVNANHHPNRRRFTIAHELGHYLLHPEASEVFVDRSPVFFRDGNSAEGVDQNEVDANAFAAGLLMPEKDLIELLDDQPVDAFDDVSVRRLSARFGVSTQALTIRLTTLGLVSEF